MQQPLKYANTILLCLPPNHSRHHEDHTQWPKGKGLQHSRGEYDQIYEESARSLPSYLQEQKFNTVQWTIVYICWIMEWDKAKTNISDYKIKCWCLESFTNTKMQNCGVNFGGFHSTHCIGTKEIQREPVGLHQCTIQHMYTWLPNSAAGCNVSLCFVLFMKLTFGWNVQLRASYLLFTT